MLAWFAGIAAALLFYDIQLIRFIKLLIYKASMFNIIVLLNAYHVTIINYKYHISPH